ncbi:hypothetical protein B0J18DRAFT_414714 [Chaetomium sp. MPI-SDFR-AT-0129]|nr:hypothetical protein B0J18DRAFT_414714 [Chaetomium sp. MPI-SDFR-AT-0129]
MSSTLSSPNLLRSISMLLSIVIHPVVVVAVHMANRRYLLQCFNLFIPRFQGTEPQAGHQCSWTQIAAAPCSPRPEFATNCHQGRRDATSPIQYPMSHQPMRTDHQARGRREAQRGRLKQPHVEGCLFHFSAFTGVPEPQPPFPTFTRMGPQSFLIGIPACGPVPAGCHGRVSPTEKSFVAHLSTQIARRQ